MQSPYDLKDSGQPAKPRKQDPRPTGTPPGIAPAPAGPRGSGSPADKKRKRVSLEVVTIGCLVAIVLLQVAIIRWQYTARAKIRALREEVSTEAEARQKLAVTLQEKVKQAAEVPDPGAMVLTTRRRLNVRSGPSTRSRRQSRLRKGAVVKQVSSQGPWVEVAYGSKTGWVSGKYLQPVTRAKVKARTLNARAEPSGKSAQAGTLRRGDIHEVIDYQDQWLCLRLNPGGSGWVHRKYVYVLP